MEFNSPETTLKKKKKPHEKENGEMKFDYRFCFTQPIQNITVNQYENLNKINIKYKYPLKSI